METPHSSYWAPIVHTDPYEEACAPTRPSMTNYERAEAKQHRYAFYGGLGHASDHGTEFTAEVPQTTYTAGGRLAIEGAAE